MTITIDDYYSNLMLYDDNTFFVSFYIESQSEFDLKDLTFSIKSENFDLIPGDPYLCIGLNRLSYTSKSSNGILTVTPESYQVTDVSRQHTVQVFFDIDDPFPDLGEFEAFIKANPRCGALYSVDIDASYLGQSLASEARSFVIEAELSDDTQLKLDEATNVTTVDMTYSDTGVLRIPEGMPFTATTEFSGPQGEPTSVEYYSYEANAFVLVPEGAGGDWGYTYDADADTRTLELHGKVAAGGPLRYRVSALCPISEEQIRVDSHGTFAFTSVVLDDGSNPKFDFSSYAYYAPSTLIKSTTLLFTERDEETLANFDPATDALTWTVELNRGHNKLGYPAQDNPRPDGVRKPVFSSVIANGQSYVEGSFKLDATKIGEQSEPVSPDKLTDVFSEPEDAKNGKLSLVLPAEPEYGGGGSGPTWFTDDAFKASYRTKLKAVSTPDEKGEIRIQNEAALRASFPSSGSNRGDTRATVLVPSILALPIRLTDEAVKIIPPGSVTVTKTGGGKTLAGAEFKLTCNGLLGNPWTKTYTGTTAADGTVTFDKLPQTGSYTLTETKAPDGYERSKEPIEFSLPDKSGKFGADKLKLSIEVDNKAASSSSSSSSSEGNESSSSSSSSSSEGNESSSSSSSSSSEGNESSSTPPSSSSEGNESSSSSSSSSSEGESSSTPSSGSSGGGSSSGGESGDRPIINPPSSSGTSPTPPTPPVVTPPNTPVGGDVDVPPGGSADVTDPPQNGDADVDDDGHWTYTPNPGYAGDDRFTITVQDPKGKPKKYIILVKIVDEPTPQSEKPIAETGRRGSNVPAVVVALTSLGVCSLAMLRKKPE